jgi:hypothetical protein
LHGYVSKGDTTAETSEFSLELELPSDQLVRHRYIQEIGKLETEKKEFKKEIRDERDDNKKLLIQMQDYARLKAAESDYAFNYGLAALITIIGSLTVSIENFMSLPLSAPCNHYVGVAIIITGSVIGYVRPAVSHVIRLLKNRGKKDGTS